MRSASGAATLYADEVDRTEEPHAKKFWSLSGLTKLRNREVYEEVLEEVDTHR